MSNDDPVLVLGLGNSLLGDDAAGPGLVRQMAEQPLPMDRHDRGVRWLDGGTIGLALLPDIENCAALVAVDAAQLAAPPGTVRVFEGAAMDAQLTGRKRSAHEVALADLMAAAALEGRLPARRALVAVQPQQLQMGQGLSAAVQAAWPQMQQAVLELLQRWCIPEADAPTDEELTCHD